MPRRKLHRQIRKLAELSVMKALGYCTLAVVTAMSGIAFDPPLAFRWGAIFMLAVAVTFDVCARRYHRVRRINETEVWNMIPEAERPSREEARPLIVAAMQAELREKSLWAGLCAGLFLLTSVFFRLFLPELRWID